MLIGWTYSQISEHLTQRCIRVALKNATRVLIFVYEQRNKSAGNGYSDMHIHTHTYYYNASIKPTIKLNPIIFQSEAQEEKTTLKKNHKNWTNTLEASRIKVTKEQTICVGQE